MEISTATFDYVRDLVGNQAGIVLEPEKHYLVDSRLMPIARRRGFASTDALVAHAKTSGDAELRNSVIEAMTTNETTFFRDGEPFEALKHEVLPRLIKARESVKRLQIWCAASSTGQEPYSLAMLLQEHFPQLASWDVTILGTDLSEDVLTRARNAKYSQLEVNRGLPAVLLVKYFEKTGLEWTVKSNAGLRERVRFDKLNLVKPWPPIGTFDVVMLRNVMIYFDVPTKQRIFSQLAGVLRHDGVLFLGSAETTIGIHAGFERETWRKTGFYKQIVA